MPKQVKFALHCTCGATWKGILPIPIYSCIARVWEDNHTRKGINLVMVRWPARNGIGRR